MSDYNGWTNYATWRVNLEMFDGKSPEDLMGVRRPELHDLKEALKEWAVELIHESCDAGIAQDYAMAFLWEVNWYEIAEHMLEDYAEEEEEED